MTTHTPTLDIAIIGAGIAGLTAAIALRKHPLVNVVVYDKASVLREIGASIALGPNGLRTLQRLGLDDIIAENGFRGVERVGMIYRHWQTNEVLGTDGDEAGHEELHRTARFHRGHLHGALLSHVPAESVKLGKKISSIDTENEGVTLGFEDGTSAKADLVIGADGIRSGVRTLFVPNFPLNWSGWTAFRSIFPASLTKSIPNLPQDATHWWSPKTTFFSSPLRKNLCTIVGGIYLDPALTPLENGTWDRPADVKILRDTYEMWNPVVKALSEVTPEIRVYPNLACLQRLERWVFGGGRVVLVGDAAHAHGGAFATGGSLAIEDAYALSLALFSVLPALPVTTTASSSSGVMKPGPQELEGALRLYEDIRKPHAERLLAKVHAANELKLGRLREGRVESDEELRERAGRGSDTAWLHEYDVVRAFEEVVKRRSADDAKL
ncbi:hypothetical protein BLS_009328 [Venturia inaequalis]|uniref:FAD-binding domain-containing protein n=1 Tax=Venturia inaequalis TaxID=5025 RepID=A0A8H3VVW1_VENIN|nr:hypothetical protein BLS_009328 [Venturia inaequalis]KAE9974625.1 hypothetical protein EG328_003742 [Venturia inaequalis]KAE9993769.1 hypothetical protein EG327_003273 [Venturia inaequalis]RDI81357.1 hypothetical protein Vi05172_g8670 [Venturia inaequalis]